MNTNIMESDDNVIIASGYKPELKRNLTFFETFAISFSYISALTGIFANYGFSISKAGAFSVWSWIFVAMGQILVALIFAEMAGRIPLTGSSYNWNSKMINVTVGWFTGWMALFAYIVGIAAVVVTFFPVFSALTSYQFNNMQVRYLGAIIILLMAAINIYGVKASAKFNLWAVIIEIGAMILFTILLFSILFFSGNLNTSLVTTIPADFSSYLPAFLMSGLLAGWTLMGFEGAADVSEETVNARKVAPKSILYSTIACAILGFSFVITLTLGINDLEALLQSSSPVIFIVEPLLGIVSTQIFLLAVLISIIGCAFVNMTGATRLLFAMARDNRVFAAKYLKQVSLNKVPYFAICFVAISACCFIVLAEAATSLYGSGAVLFYLFYLVTVFGYLLNIKKLPNSPSFDLGHWRYVVAPTAVIWLIIEIGILTIPTDFHSVAITTSIILLLGIITYFIFGRTKS